MDLRFPVLAISEGKRFTGIWACADETACRQGTRDAFDRGAWDNLDLIDSGGRVYSVAGAHIDTQLPARGWSQRVLAHSRLVQVSFDLKRCAAVDFTTVQQRVLRIVDDDEEGFDEGRAIDHDGDFEEWRSRLGSADSFELLIALFL